ncbi:MAG TPA: ectoine synthase [Candidatus Limnocylindria bacterium]|nr:ectoine synthase [Candidatus Limnocylindria bacterium]
MIIRTLDEVIGTERDVAGEGWRSRRLLLKRDAMGFSLHDTVVEAGWEKEMEYANHLEACYLMQGEAEITDLATGQRYQLGPGAVYALDAYDRHRLHAKTELRLVCVFNPALAGGETHNESGGFERAPE